MDSKKIVAAAVVALFCFTAYACVVTDDADAASKKYELYVEILDDDHILDDYVYVYFESEADNQKYCEAANKALAAAGYSDVKLEVNQYGVSVKYKENSSSSTWYSNGKDWAPVSKMAEDFINNAKAGAAVNGAWINEEEFEELPVTEQAVWAADGHGYYQKKLETNGATGEIKNYKVNLTMIDNDLIKTSSITIEFTCENEGAAWSYAFNQAVKGNSIFSKTVASYSSGMISIAFGDSFSNVSYVKNDGKWVFVEDTVKSYTSGNDLDFELNHGYISKAAYDKLSSSEQKNWKESGMTYEGYEYMRVPSASSSSGGDFPIIYVVVAIVAILLIACAAYYLMKNKKTA